MKGISLGIRPLEQKALLLSFLFHLFLAQIIVFTFPSSSMIRRPFFNFLGGILENTDFVEPLSYGLSQGSSRKQRILPQRHTSNEWDVVPTKSSFEPGQTKRELKQSLTQDAAKEQKKFLKDVFVSPAPKADANSILKDFGVTPPPAYVPLKLNRVKFQ
jgi:hypothetical protein